MSDKDKKVVNTEEQNRAVNPGDSEYQEDSISQDAVPGYETDGSGVSEKPTPEKSENEAKRPSRIEGDDASGIERNDPNV